MLICCDKNLRKNSRPTNCINAFSFQKKAIAIERDDKSIFAFHGHFMFYSGTGDFVHKENPKEGESVSGIERILFVSMDWNI